MSVATKSAAKRKPILDRFGLTEHALLGAGNESNIYALDHGRALRIYDPGADLDHVRRLAAFYRELAAEPFGVALPLFEPPEQAGNVIYCIERRLPGKSLSPMLAALEGAARHRAMTEYAAYATQIASLPLWQQEFGEIVRDHPLRRASWVEFVLDRAEQTLSTSREMLRREVPGFDAVVERWSAAVQRLLSDVDTPRLVHNDYFPGNVMVSGDGDLTAIIDFSPVAGDPRLDLAGALLFLEMTPGARSADAAFVAERLGGAGDEKLQAIFDLYGTYYALYYSDCRLTDPDLYRWCMRWLAAH